MFNIIFAEQEKGHWNCNYGWKSIQSWRPSEITKKHWSQSQKL